MLLIFSCTDYVFGLLVWWLCHLFFLSWIIVCPLFCISHLLPLLPPFATLVFSSVHNIIDLFSTLFNIGLLFCLLSMDSFIHPMLKTSGQAPVVLKSCNRLERFLAQKIVSNPLWKLAELTDEAVDWLRKLKTAIEILASALPNKAIALFAAFNAYDTCLECILDHHSPHQDHQGQLWQCQWWSLDVHPGKCCHLHGGHREQHCHSLKYISHFWLWFRHYLGL